MVHIFICGEGAFMRNYILTDDVLCFTSNGYGTYVVEKNKDFYLSIDCLKLLKYGSRPWPGTDARDHRRLGHHHRQVRLPQGGDTARLQPDTKKPGLIRAPAFCCLCFCGQKRKKGLHFRKP